VSSSLADDVGQVLWFGFHGTSASPALLAAIGRGEVGAVVVFKRNLVIETAPVAGAAGREVIDLACLAALNRALHAAAPPETPLLIAIDQEGGSVQRVRAPATEWPAMMTLDRHPAPDDQALAREVGSALGSELAALGFDIDFAPVLDIHTNPMNPVIGDRAFGTDPESVARRAIGVAAGLDDAGILACGKHFPGHGDTDTDSHLALPRLTHGWDRLEAIELAPFRLAAAAGLPMMMTAHVVFAAIDADRPATLTSRVIDDLLRRRFGYRGVIVSDDLDMRAIVDHVGVDEAAVQAIAAGCDALLLCRDESHQQLARAALLRAAATDDVLRTRLAEAATRVRRMKRDHVARRLTRPVAGMEIVGCEAHRRLADRLAGRGA
jgi:beta-N-acetylhexosaminidase